MSERKRKNTIEEPDPPPKRTRPQIQEIILDNQLAKICLWVNVIEKVSAIWHRLEKVLKGRKTYLKKVVNRTEEKSGRHRFYLFVDCDKVGEVEKCLRQNGKRNGWIAKIASPFSQRREKRKLIPFVDEVQRIPENVNNHTVRIGTWNVRTMHNNRADVERYLAFRGMGILLCQEARRTRKQFAIKVSGYNVFESLAEEARGRNGLATFVRKDLTAYSLTYFTIYFMGRDVLCSTNGSQFVIEG